ncbi:phosphopentomutase [Falsirhodobacter sp. alg1]|uniref:phosphopentomutase n=1 Tax=Falsirhodobacter sp. alg1 TaxID=1472418 RepID=UPI0005EE7ECC|nr:phosphopentomutase [Falsirhodobacter sp. alg1]
MSRAFLLVMDSVGIGGAPDATVFGDEGSNTVGHIAQTVPLKLPTLDRLGLGAALHLASGLKVHGLGAAPAGMWGAATEVSPGKDTPSGHWELTGVPVPWDWTYFPRAPFDDELVAEICRLADVDGILDGGHSGGLAVIDRLGAEHMRNGRPICYTSSDSVFQIAAHEETFGLDRLLALCERLAPMLHARRVGRVIARPFVGAPGSFQRTPHRRDYAIAPPSPTLLDRAQEAGHVTHAVGKIGDIFSHRGITHLHKGANDAALFDHVLELADTAEDGAFVFANFVEFDSVYGHPRNVPGYARHLEWFDGAVAQLLPRLRPDDIVVITADHGNDPTWHGNDHTRERVPVLVAGLTGELGLIPFVGVGKLIADHLGIPALSRT